MNIELSTHAPVSRYRTMAESPSEPPPAPDWRDASRLALSMLREAERQSPTPAGTVALRTAIDALQAALWTPA